MKNQIGLSLLELISSLSIISILGASAVPSLQQALTRSEGKSIAAIVRRSAAAARHHAITNEQSVTLCGVNENGVCQRNQLQQLIIFLDVNRNRQVDPGEHLFHAFDVSTENILSLRASFRRNYIQFNEDGSASQAGSFIYCASATPTANKRVTVSMSGRTYLGRDNNGDGVVELTNGQPISC